MKTIISNGQGYWDTTTLPYGGEFRRSDGTVEIVEIIGPAGMHPAREREVRLASGRTAVVEVRGIENVE